MRYLKTYKTFENWNPVTNKEVLEFIELNKTNLLHLWDKEKSEEENMQFLIDYFTEYPDEMKSVLKGDNIKMPISKSSLRNSAPILQNIGSTNDFRSF